MQQETRQFYLTDHASAQAQRRGIPKRIITAIVAYGDISLPVGKGCRSLMISRRRLAELELDDLHPADREKADGAAIIVAANGDVITVMHLHGRCAARYRRRFKTHRPVRPSGRQISPNYPVGHA